MQITKVISVALLAGVMAVPAAYAGAKKVGIAMPTQSSSRWISDGHSMLDQFKAAGFDAELQYAEDDIPNQVNQIENMVTKGVDVLVIASIDGTTLTDIIARAHEEGVKIFAYDRLIRNSPYVDYYSTFDNFQVGVQQASSLVDGLGLSAGKTGPFNIELFAGSPDDNNATFFYNGAMSVLNPYIEKKELVVQSGQTDFQQIATMRWDGATAQARMDNILSANYTDKQVNAVLSPYDGISIGIISSLKGVGYGTQGTPMPLVSGQDAELPSVKAIIAGEQYSTIFKDTRELAKQTVKMVSESLEGKEVEVNDTKTYDNGVKVVPSYLLKPVLVTKANYMDVVIKSGYYSEDQLK